MSGPRARAGHDLVLRVVADAEREQFPELTGEVLVLATLHVRVVVEVEEHRGVPADGVSQRAEVAQRVRPEHGVLLVHEREVPDRVLGRREMAVPEQRQLFDERGRARDHALVPPLDEADPLVPLGRADWGERVGRPRRAQDVVDGRRAVLADECGDLGQSPPETRSSQKMRGVVHAERWHARPSPSCM